MFKYHSGFCHLIYYTHQSVTSHIYLEATPSLHPHPCLSRRGHHHSFIDSLNIIWTSLAVVIILLPPLLHYHQKNLSKTQLLCVSLPIQWASVILRIKYLTWFTGLNYVLALLTTYSSFCDLPIPIVSEHVQLALVVVRNGKINWGSRQSDLLRT